MNDFNNMTMPNGGGYGGCGIYTAQSQFNLDENMMLKLKFTRQEIQAVKQVFSYFGTVTSAKAQQCGYPPEIAKKLKYMYDIATGNVVIESSDDLSKHFRKMFGAHQRIGIQHLSMSRINKVPRKCVLGNIPAGKFEMYNSKHYSPQERMYDVLNVTGAKITINTARKPVLRYGESKEQDGVAKITEVNRDGTINIEFNRDYARLCNRFIVVASLRRPEYYHALVEIICIEGTKVYVFATTMSDKETPSYKNGSQRVYDYGFFKAEIKRKVMNVASILYKHLCGVYAQTEEGNTEFEFLRRDVRDDEDEAEKEQIM